MRPWKWSVYNVVGFFIIIFLDNIEVKSLCIYLFEVHMVK